MISKRHFSNIVEKIASVEMKHTEEHVNSIEFSEKNVMICIILCSGLLA